MKTYTLNQFVKDIVAGIIVAIIAFFIPFVSFISSPSFLCSASSIVFIFSIISTLPDASSLASLYLPNLGITNFSIINVPITDNIIDVTIIIIKFDVKAT